MPPSRHALAFFAGVVALAAGTRAAVAVTPDPMPAEDQGAATSDADAGDAVGDDGAIAAPMPAAFLEISGAATGALAAAGEAQTTWRYGRARGQSVNESSSRLRVNGSGRTLDGSFHGLSVAFSLAIIVPALRVGTYAAGTVPGVAAAWARQDRASAAPDIEWEAKDASGRDGGLASFVVTVTSIGETSHSSDRRGGVTLDVTDFRVHGEIDATLACTRSAASLRQSCRPETIHGSF